MSTINDEYCLISAWSMDFERALNKKSFLHKLLFRLVLGKYAFREFYGMREALKKNGYSNEYSYYELERCKYQKDKIPFIWWKE